MTGEPGAPRQVRTIGVSANNPSYELDPWAGEVLRRVKRELVPSIDWGTWEGSFFRMINVLLDFTWDDSPLHELRFYGVTRERPDLWFVIHPHGPSCLKSDWAASTHACYVLICRVVLMIAEHDGLPR